MRRPAFRGRPGSRHAARSQITYFIRVRVAPRGTASSYHDAGRGADRIRRGLGTPQVVSRGKRGRDPPRRLARRYAWRPRDRNGVAAIEREHADLLRPGGRAVQGEPRARQLITVDARYVGPLDRGP